MPCGLYGKLPAKRDFVALAVPRAFLTAFEPWMQGGLSASRAALGTGWQDAYLRAPIWRFWLGADLCGEALLGALMPSVDGIGRYFPLTLVARGPEPLPPPEQEAYQDWFDRVEAFLLGALTREDGFETVAADLAAMPDPAGLPAAGEPPGDGAVRLRDGTLVGPAEGGVSAALARLRPLDHARLHAGMSYWWTAGGEGFAPRVAACRRLPDPYAFAGMLTGGFDALGG